MKIKKSVLKAIVKEELANHIRSLFEAPETVDAEIDKKGKEKKDGKGEKKPTKPDKGPEAPKQASDKKNDAPPEQPPVEDPVADKEMEKDVAGDTEDAEDVTGGKIADEITGKRVQSVTMEPKSKTLPGAQEVVITFADIPDPLKILITKTGQVKFYFKGLHNTL